MSTSTSRKQPGSLGPGDEPGVGNTHLRIEGVVEGPQPVDRVRRKWTYPRILGGGGI